MIISVFLNLYYFKQVVLIYSPVRNTCAFNLTSVASGLGFAKFCAKTSHWFEACISMVK